MKPIALIIRRELAAYAIPLGWVVAAVLLLIDGLAFNVFAVGSDTARKSSPVISQFFFFSGGLAEAAGLFWRCVLSLKNAKMEPSTCFSSPIRDYQIVLGKFFAAFIFLLGIHVLSVYMPLMVLLHGKVAKGHLVAGLPWCAADGIDGLRLGCLRRRSQRVSLVAIVVGAAISSHCFCRGYWLPSRIVRLTSSFRGWRCGTNTSRRSCAGRSAALQDVAYYLSMTYVFCLRRRECLSRDGGAVSHGGKANQRRSSPQVDSGGAMAHRALFGVFVLFLGERMLTTEGPQKAAAILSACCLSPDSVGLLSRRDRPKTPEEKRALGYMMLSG